MSSSESFPAMSPEERAAMQEEILRERHQKQLDVFGEERLRETLGHEASPEAAQEFLHMVQTLCHEGGAKAHHFIRFRSLARPDSAQPLTLVTGTLDGRLGFGGFGNMDEAQASVDFISYDEKLSHQSNPTLRKLGIRNRKTFTREGVFIDTNGVAMVQREVLGKRDERSRVATKPATAEELESVMTILTEAVAYDGSSANTPTE